MTIYRNGRTGRLVSMLPRADRLTVTPLMQRDVMTGEETEIRDLDDLTMVAER